MSRIVPAAFALVPLLAATGCPEAPPEDYDAILIQLLRATAAGDQDPYQGTVFILAHLEYDEACLQDFYFNRHTDHQFEGVEGAAVKEEWMGGRLCDPDEHNEKKPIIPCEVTDMYQVLDPDAQIKKARLHVTYKVSTDDIENRHIPFGPLPTEHLANCVPIVRLDMSSVYGQDGGMSRVWQIATYEDPVAEVGQGAAIQIFAEQG